MKPAQKRGLFLFGGERIEDITLWQGDCLELMKNIPDKSVDMVLADPPYGIDYQSQRKKDKSKWMPKILNDKSPFVQFIPEIKRIIKNTGCVMIFTRWDVQHRFIDEMQKMIYLLETY